MVNIELYRIFIAIYRAGTISKAALLCDITQPAASQQLASLERTLKVKLFERTPRVMVATNDGAVLVMVPLAVALSWRLGVEPRRLVVLVLLPSAGE